MNRCPWWVRPHLNPISPWLRSVGFGLALAGSLVAASPRPNVVFILADDLGYTDLGCYGSRYYETPHLDRLAAQGLRFTSGYTCGPNCQPTRAALMSGQYGPRTGVYTVGHIDRFNWRSRSLRPVDNVEQLTLETVTLAETLQAAGYRTALFGKWHLGGDRFHPAKQGFDEAVVSMGRHFNFTTQPPVTVPKEAYLADFLTERALQFIQTHRDRPFFLCLHHFAVHAPHEAKPELIERFKNKPSAAGHRHPVYAAMIASVDESVGRVVAQLDQLNLSTNTLVIFTSDNGGVGGYEREGIKRAGDVTDNAPLRGGKGMLTEGGIRVPYVFRWPGRIPAGTVCDEPIVSVDLYPTLTQLAGARPPANQPLDGVNYAPLLLAGGRGTLAREALFWHFPGYLGAGQDTWRTTPVGVIRAREFKLLEYFEHGRLELYNLHTDLGERTNLVSVMPEKAKELQAQLAAWRRSVNAPMPRAKTAEDAASAPRPAARARAKKAAPAE